MAKRNIKYFLTATIFFALTFCLSAHAEELKPDIIVEKISVTQTMCQNNLVVGTTSIQIVYKNTGNATSTKRFVSKYDFGTAEGFFDQDLKGMPISESGQSITHLIPGAQYTETIIAPFLKAGKVTLAVSADMTNHVDELNEDNNSFAQEITIKDKDEKPDFIIKEIKISPAKPKAMELFDIETIVQNVGYDTNYNKHDMQMEKKFGDEKNLFKQQYYTATSSEPALQYYNNEFLSANSAFSTISRGYFKKSGAVKLWAKVNPHNRLCFEANFNNNELSKLITIGKEDPNRLSKKLAGRIVLQVEKNGEAWYLYPKTTEKIFLGRPADAFSTMRYYSIGITNENLNKIPIGLNYLSGHDSDNDGLPDLLEDAIGTNKNKVDTDGDGFNDKSEIENNFNPTGVGPLPLDTNFANTQTGMLFIQTEGNGEAWYVNPADGKRYFLGRPADAFFIMKNLGLGISEKDFAELI